jgi:hypothetical protein
MGALEPFMSIKVSVSSQPSTKSNMSMPGKFKTITEIEQWYAHKIETCRQEAEGRKECVCGRETCITCIRTTVLSEEMEDLAIMAAVEIEYFKKREETATVVRQMEEDHLKKKYLESAYAVEALAGHLLTLITKLNLAKARFEGIRDKVLTTIETSKKALENWASVSEALDEIGKHDS